MRRTLLRKPRIWGRNAEHGRSGEPTGAPEKPRTSSTLADRDPARIVPLGLAATQPDCSRQITLVRHDLRMITASQPEAESFEKPTFLQQMAHLQDEALRKYGFLIVSVGGSYESAITPDTHITEYQPPATSDQIGELHLSQVTDIPFRRPDGSKKDFDSIAFPATIEPDGTIRLLSFAEVENIGQDTLTRRFTEMEHGLTTLSDFMQGPVVSIEPIRYQLPGASVVKRAQNFVSNEFHRLREFASSIQVYSPIESDNPRGRLTFRLGTEEQLVPWDTLQIVKTIAPDPSGKSGENIAIYTFLPPAEQGRYRVRTLDVKSQDSGKVSADSKLGRLVADFKSFSAEQGIETPDFSSWEVFMHNIQRRDNPHATMRLKWNLVQLWYNTKLNFWPFKGRSFGEWYTHTRFGNWTRRVIE